MGMNQALFAAKHREMARQYGQLAAQLEGGGQDSPEQIRRQLQQAEEEYQAHTRVLEQWAAGSRSPAMAELAQIQLECSRKMEAVLDERLRAGQDGPGCAPAEEGVEALALYAEYTMDLATQAMQYARIAALTAMQRQMEARQKGEN